MAALLAGNLLSSQCLLAWQPQCTARAHRHRVGLLVAMFMSLSVLLTRAHVALAADFLPVEQVTRSERNHEIARNSNHSTVVAPDGSVHLVFWDGSLATLPATPSTVWYCRRHPSGQWSVPQIVDNSYISGGIRLGGRHPSLLLSASGTVHVFWHDYRHCSGTRNWMDNTEIYTDTLPPNNSFSPFDLRLTNTSALHDGDNGYAPQAVLSPTGEILLTWYDYHFNRNAADIFLMRSDEQGHFDLASSLEAYRLTDVSLRQDTLSYTLPDLALGSSNTVHLTWTKDNQGGNGVYYARLDAYDSLTTPLLLVPTGADFMDPPHISSAQEQGDIYISWTEHGTTLGDTDISIARLRPGSDTFDPPMAITSAPFNQLHCDFEPDSCGLLHIVWIDRRAGYSEVFYGIFDPETKTLVSEVKVSEGTGGCSRPCIALDNSDYVYVVWIEYCGTYSQIHFRTTAPVTRARGLWNHYY